MNAPTGTAKAPSWPLVSHRFTYAARTIFDRLVGGWISRPADAKRCWGRAMLLGVGLSGVLMGQSASEINLTNALVIGPLGTYRRQVVHQDALEAQLVAGQWRRPVAGQSLMAAGQERAWQELASNREGWLQHEALRGGYAFVACPSDQPRVLVLEASGHNLVYANGELRAGDPYGHGYVRLPVLLQPGTNEFLFQVGRGRLKAKLVPPKSPGCFNLGDLTLPDLLVGEKAPVWGAAVVLNATTNALEGVQVRAGATGAKKRPQLAVTVPPLTVRKVPFLIPATSNPAPGEAKLELELIARCEQQDVVLDQAQIGIALRRADQLHKRTFISGIDGSVQYYAVQPPAPLLKDLSGGKPALFLALHGAAVEALGHAGSYHPKSWGVLISPTNRRPYGFDWEDWGRMDALEVLEAAQARFHTDPRRTYLTGHSMGGHGAWHLGVTFPDRFAALAPSAGWISFASYAGTNRLAETNALSDILRRASASSDTLSLASNYLHHGVYILHGTADDNVPVREARTMKDLLAKFHPDFDYHEQPGAGHWWDASDDAGVSCVDWPPIFDLFARHRLPDPNEIRRVRFATINPGVSSRCHWAAILAQEQMLAPSHIDASFDPGQRRLVAHTQNAASVQFDLTAILSPDRAVTVVLDGQRFEKVPWPRPMPETGVFLQPRLGADPRPLSPRSMLTFRQENGRWSRISEDRRALEAHKHPACYGPFKEAFQNRVVLVYGTRGSAAENAWAYGKARYDAEVFWYRGNGSLELMADHLYLERRPRRSGDRSAAPARNVVLYGHAAQNAAWTSLLADSPVQVQPGGVRVCQRELPGDKLACLFVRPLRGGHPGLVACIAGTGLPGLRLAERVPIFLSGAGIPDCLVVAPEMLTQGAAGVRVAGFFGPDWSVERGLFAWP